MKISDLITGLELAKLKYGDIEVTMQGTLLTDGFSATDSEAFPDVFESTVETAILCDKNDALGKRLRLFWQT